jgi:putative hydrolase of the HAD superfamily
VLFDYGDTLFTFRYEERAHVAALRALIEHVGADVPAQRVFEEFGRRFAAAEQALGEHDELRYAELMADVLEAVGIQLGEDGLVSALRAEHRAWDAARELHPDTPRMLRMLREQGLGVGLVSNAFDPPDLMHDDLERHGIAGLIDAAVFSSELGVRKPHPAIYREVLGRLGVAPDRAMFVGDRVREDVEGPAAVGMLTCLATYYRSDAGDHSLADFRACTPLEVVEIVRELEVAAG